tara:strand:+ start:228 stop:836 length:609 start_codon:yes stop_codon:yes gene_type:complete
MPVSATELAMLSSPVPVPAELGDNQSPFTARDVSANSALSGAAPDPSGVQLPIRSGATMFSSENLPTSILSNENLSMSGARYSGPADVVGERVGGLVGQSPESRKRLDTFIPEEKDNIEEQTNMFLEADKEGYNARGVNVEGGIKAARATKRESIAADRKARKEAGLKGSAKRRARRAQRDERKKSWQNYKAEIDLQNLEQL